MEPVLASKVNRDRQWLRRKNKPVSSKLPKSEIRMIDLFSGCGGITLGVEAACNEMNIHLNPVIAWDIFEAATDVYSKNFSGCIIRSEPIETIIDGERGEPPTRSEKLFMETIGEIQLIVGGPPCQGNSNLNNHTRGTDERNLLYLRMARVIEILKPDYAIIENVAGVRRAQQDVVTETNNWLESIGYSTVEGLINGKHVGVPQMRKRHFTIASKQNDLVLEAFQQREGVEIRPISWAIQDLLDVYDEDDVLNSASKATETNQKRMNYLIENDVHNLPSEERPICHQKYDEHGPTGNTYPAVYGRMYWDLPAPTITTGYSCNGRGRFVHPKLPRCLTVREAARVQSFPDYFDFSGHKRTNLNRMIGNAVPPLMAKHIAMILLTKLVD
jgi:DNA (cytosine-5)-methyltransferase 1